MLTNSHRISSIRNSALLCLPCDFPLSLPIRPFSLCHLMILFCLFMIFLSYSFPFLPSPVASFFPSLLDFTSFPSLHLVMNFFLVSDRGAVESWSSSGTGARAASAAPDRCMRAAYMALHRWPRAASTGAGSGFYGVFESEVCSESGVSGAGVTRGVEAAAPE